MGSFENAIKLSDKLFAGLGLQAQKGVILHFGPLGNVFILLFENLINCWPPAGNGWVKAKGVIKAKGVRYSFGRSNGKLYLTRFRVLDPVSRPLVFNIFSMGSLINAKLKIWRLIRETQTWVSPGMTLQQENRFQCDSISDDRREIEGIPFDLAALFFNRFSHHDAILSFWPVGS